MTVSRSGCYLHERVCFVKINKSLYAYDFCTFLVCMLCFKKDFVKILWCYFLSMILIYPPVIIESIWLHEHNMRDEKKYIEPENKQIEI